MKHTHLHLLFFTIIACLFTACSPAKDTSGDSALSHPLDSLFTSMFKPGQPGAIVLVAKGDSIIYNRGFGMADLSKGTEITDTTLFNICSISKQFAAVAILQLHEKGLLDIDDSIAKFIPALSQPFFHNVTLRHLMSHTSGIPDSRPRTEQQWNQYRAIHRTPYATCHDYKLYALTKESTRYMRSLDSLVFEPGTAYEYQNPTYQLLLPVIEDASRQRFTPWMQENIFDRAGLRHTEYLDPACNQTYFAHAYKPAVGENVYDYYRSDDGCWEECDYGEADFFPTKTDGGLYTSARDFLRWERALFSGKVISDSMLTVATTPVIATDLPYTSYGLGLFIEEKPGMPRKIFHTGDNGGFYTVEAFYPEHDIFYLVFANRPDWNREAVVADIDSILLANKYISPK